MDLTNMDAIDPAALVAELATADVIIAFWPDGGQVAIKGDYSPGEIMRGEAETKLSVLRLKLADTTQAELVYSALTLIEHKDDRVAATVWAEIFHLIGELRSRPSSWWKFQCH